MAANAMSVIFAHRHAMRPMRAGSERRPPGATDKALPPVVRHAMGPNQARASAEQGAELEVETTDDANRFAWHGGRVSEERSAFDRTRERRRAAGRFGSAPEGRLCSDVGCCRRDGRLELDARRRRLERQKDDQASEQGADQTDECRAPRRHLLMLNHRKLLVQPGTVVRALELQRTRSLPPGLRKTRDTGALRHRAKIVVEHQRHPARCRSPVRASSARPRRNGRSSKREAVIFHDVANVR
jgi:hypothetical protein